MGGVGWGGVGWGGVGVLGGGGAFVTRDTPVSYLTILFIFPVPSNSPSLK